jgi:hypothetical protein
VEKVQFLHKKRVPTSQYDVFWQMAKFGLRRRKKVDSPPLPNPDSLGAALPVRYDSMRRRLLFLKMKAAAPYFISIKIYSRNTNPPFFKWALGTTSFSI